MSKLTVASDEKLGIENLKSVLGLILLVSYKLGELIKAFDFSKALSLAFLIGENLGTIQRGKLALAEFKDLSVAESQQIVDFLGVNFDISDDNLEQRIEQGLQFIPEGYQLIKNNIDFYLRIKGWINSWGKVDEAAIKALPAKLSLAA